ncbi:Wzz/FepE/Etk N-terminal domain-containing protein [Planomicrobium sp. Y74]|uniref:YveK family protein n=1 Tax=Planomicrobium sp. Y74 TaxID=2478977 RepID=UPI0013145FB2|nr:Wzz/FepE/Etk N-terminal domain-containing protein [Planomicrobium sp. Y74]
MSKPEGAVSSMEEANSLKNLINRMRKHRSLIASLASLAVIAAGIISYFLLTLVYETSTKILVNQSSAEKGQLTNQNLQANLKLINTYSGIIKSPAILNQIVKELNLEMTSDQLEDDIYITNEKQTQITTITIQNEDPAMAVEIANTIVDTFENDNKEMIKLDIRTKTALLLLAIGNNRRAV